MCRIRSSNTGSPLFDCAHRPEPRSRTSAFVWHLVSVCLVNVDIRAGSRAPLQVNWQVAASCRRVNLQLGVKKILSTYSLHHLADLGCRLILRNLRTPCSSPHKCSSVFSVLPNQTSSSQFTSNWPRSSLVPGTRAQTISPKQASPPR